MLPGRAPTERRRSEHCARTRPPTRALVLGTVVAIVTVGAGAGVARATKPEAPRTAVPPHGSAGTAKTSGEDASDATDAVRAQVPEIDHEHLFVKFRTRPTDLPARIARAGARLDGAIGRTTWTTLSTADDAVAVKERLEDEPAVSHVRLSYVRRALTTPTDPRWASAQKHYLAPLRMDRAWDIAKGAPVKVAVVDSGVNAQHPDLRGRVGPGVNIVPSVGNVQDDLGHGTVVAGVIAANINNGRGIAGIAPQAQILPVKVLDASGAGTDAEIAQGITWAATHGAEVLNLSIGGPGGGDVLCAAVNNALAADVVVVAAAGNDGDETVGYPAACPGVLTVSATNDTGALTSFSSYGWRVDVAAPGLDITSTSLSSSATADTYATESGTSLSSPIVAGVAALVRSHEPGLSRAQVVERIVSTARDVGPPGVDRAFGHGVVDPLAALGRPALGSGAVFDAAGDEPNDAAARATPLHVGATYAAQIAPETDEDWYDADLDTGWYTVHVPIGDGGLEHDMQPVVQLYDANMHFLASQEFAGGNLVFNIGAPGSYFVRVANRGGNTAAYEVTISPRAAPPLFGDALPLDLGSAAQSAGVGDVNGDGRNDVVFLMGDTSALADTLVVLTQTARRSFAVGDVVATPEGVSGGGLVVGDVNGDGRSDVAYPTTTGVEVLLQTVHGLELETSIGTTAVSQLAIADVDHDGRADIVTAEPSGVRVFWGPAFTPAASTYVSPESMSSVSVGDLTNDARLDIVTTRANTVSAFLYSGSRAFIARAPVRLTDVSNVAYDPDKRQVVATQRQTPGKFTRFGDNETQLAPSSASTTLLAGKPEPVAVADIDGSGNDVIVMHDDAGEIEVVRGNGTIDERFFVDDQASSHYDSRALAVGDIDGDTLPDVVVATSFGISLLMHRADALPATYGSHLVADVTPAPRATGVAAAVRPTLSLSIPATNASTSVKLRDAHGDPVASSVTGDGTTTITVTPHAPLDNGTYVVHADGLTDGGGNRLDGYAAPFFVGPPPDQTAPTVTFDGAPSGYRPLAGVQIRFRANDSAASFECSRDGAPYVTCVSPYPSFTVAAGSHTFRVIARDAAGNESSPKLASWTYRPAPAGYWMVGAAGAVYNFGTTPRLGSPPPTMAVDMEATPSGYGYWVVDALGRVYAFGDAGRYGNAGALASGEHATSISRTGSGKGYWLFTSRGRVMAFGDAHWYGDLRKTRLNGPVLDSVRTASGRGYYMVASDGGVFAFGDARFYGSTGNRWVSASIRTLTPDPDGVGYWLVGRDGAVYPFRAASHGSMAGKPLNKPIVGMVAFGTGYLMVASDGGIFNFSSKPFYGSLGARPPRIGIVAVAAYG
jgi:type VII secretion-associated serine protease mycosin